MSDLETAVVALDDLELDRLAAGDVPVGDPVLAMLAALRDDVSTDLPDDGWPALRDDDVVVPLQGRRRGTHAPRHLSRGAVAAAAAIAVVSAGGVAAASVAAGPGSPLYPVREALVGPAHHESDVSTVQHLLSGAATALADGRLSTARDQLVKAERMLRNLGSADATAERTRLAVLQQQLNRNTTSAPAAGSATPASPVATAPAASASASPAAGDASASPSGGPSASTGSDPSAQPSGSASGTPASSAPTPAPSRNPWQGHGQPPVPVPAPAPVPSSAASAPSTSTTPSDAPTGDPATADATGSPAQSG